MFSIEVNNLNKTFGKFIAVNNISFKVKEGEIFGFLGANGAGKSTTIKMLCGLLEQTSGDALIGGYSIKTQADLVKKNIGYMSQRFSLYNDLTIEENIKFFGGVYGLEGKELTNRMQWILNTANLIGKENILTGSLPGGIKQRLALGTAVIHKPKIVFLDEPTSGVDPISRRSFWELINELSGEGITVLVTTHYLEEAEYCGNIILINAGNLIAEGNSKVLKTKYLQNPIYEIKCNNVVDAMEIFDKSNFVDETSIFGNSIHLIMNENFTNESLIYNELKKLPQIKIEKVEKIVPTLEDVFIHLLEKDKK
ncbi:MAG: ABC transporter ATP-binding protein [Ignavibacteriae bacterium]|nr:ABC transporter ATP-binding protein [Ignavibacteriota bacterium]